MRDVAQHAGVSIQTISAVLNGKSGISAQTSERVRGAIAALGYQPNLLASSLRRRRSGTIGLLLPNVANPYFAEIARGVEDTALARGYSVILCNHDDDPAKRAGYVQLLRQYQVAGIIGASPDEDAVRSYTPRTSAKSATSPHFSAWPLPDDRRGGYVATTHLLDLGHRRIGCVTGPLLGMPGSARLAGYRQALADWSVPVEESLIVEGAFDFASGRRAAGLLLERGAVPPAIFAHNDPMAIGVIVTLKRAGLRVPDDVAVIGYDGTEIAALYDPPVSTVIQRTYELGAYAMDALANQIEGRSSSPDTRVLDCELVVRRSTVPELDGERWCGSNTGEQPWAAWRVGEEVPMP
jgi:LacI family transcriptional regulator